VNSPTPSLFRAKVSSYCHYGNEGEDQSISEGVIAQSLIVKSGCALGRSYMLFMPLLRYDRLWSADVNRENESKTLHILPVPRTKEEAKQAYDRISRCYDYTIGAFGRRYAKMALELLSIVEGEIVLEVGFGTGHCLKRIAECVGQTGKVYGIDISSGMIEITKKRLEKAGLVDRVELFRGDAAFLPFDDNTLDAVFMSFVLEVFDTPEIPRALEQVKKVLKP
jgi:predicted O-methyltransferase YrrM